MATAVFLLEVFGAGAFGGNIAGVVLLESRAPHEWMLAVTAELGAPTTGFVHVPSARRMRARDGGRRGHPPRGRHLAGRPGRGDYPGGRFP